MGGRRGPVAVGVAVVAVFGAVACEPGNGISAAAVAITTDQTGTRELEKQGVDVQWLSCTASYGDKGATAGSSPSARSVASVDCVGEEQDGREITIKGKVTQEVNGTCVRGDLTAKVGGKEWFRVDVLGNCRAGTPGTVNPLDAARRSRHDSAARPAGGDRHRHQDRHRVPAPHLLLLPGQVIESSGRGQDRCIG
ncbi:hypothetical protein ACRJ4W_54545 [Streptomyces sp. GLT-R25]